MHCKLLIFINLNVERRSVMPVLDQTIVDTIKRHLRSHRRGMTITDLSASIHLNRNLVAKYLDMLLISGQVEMQVIGAAKVFFLSQRVPISAMLEFSSDYVIVLDAEQRIIQVNEKVLSILDEKKDMLVGKKINEYDNPFLHSLTAFRYPKDLHNYEETITETCCVLHGSTFYFRVKQVPTAFEDGGHGWTLIIEEITAKKMYEETLRMNEARYRGIVEDQTEFITRFRPDESLLFANNSYARYLGKNSSDILGQHHIPGICDADRIAVSKAIRSLDQEHPLISVECRVTDPSGRQCWNVWTVRALFDAAGNLNEYQGVGRDTTDKREAARRINQYIAQMDFFSRKLQEFIELSPDVDIYNAIGSGLEEILPDSAIGISSYEPGSGMLTVRAVFGEKERDSVARYLGKSLLSISVPREENVSGNLFTGMVYPVKENLHDLLYPPVSPEIWGKFFEDLNVGNIYSIGLVWQNLLLGNMIFGLRKGTSLKDTSLIETYARAASIALQRQIAEDAFKESERKRAEEVLKNSENYLLTIFNATQSGLMVVDPETRSIYDANSTAIALIAEEKRSLIGSSCNEYLCPKGNQKCPVIDLGNEIIRSEGILRNSRGEERPIIRTVVPVQLGGRSYLLESFIDITERKRAEEALLASEKRFHALAEMLPQNIWECDNRGNVTFVNHRGCEMYGYTLEDVQKGMTIWQTIHPDDREQVIDDFVQALAREPGEFPEFHEFMSIRKDGSVFPLITYHLPIVHENKITGMRGIGIDITDRKRAEEALKESEERFRLLVESVPFGIVFITFDGTIEYANPAFEKICGFTREEFPDLTAWGERVFSDTGYREKIFGTWLKQIPEIIGTNLHADNLFRIRCRDGKEKDILFTAVFFANGKTLVTIDDLTERKRSEGIIRENQVRLNQL
jgi:PAS domain S-box-containing protein